MKVKNIILLTLIVIIALFATSVFIAQSNRLAEMKGHSAVGKIGDLNDIVKRCQRNIRVAITGLRGYLLTNERPFLNIYDSAIVDNEKILTLLSDRFAAGSDQKALIDDITEIQEYYIMEYAKPLIAARQSTDKSPQSVSRFNDFYRLKLASKIEHDVVESIDSKFKFVYSSQARALNDVQEQVSKKTSPVSVDTVLSIISALLASGLAVWLACYVSSKAKRIVKMAKAVSEGNFNTPMGHDGADEFSLISTILVDICFTMKAHTSRINQLRLELDELTQTLLHEARFPLSDIQNSIHAIQTHHICTLNEPLLSQIASIHAKVSKVEEVVTAITMYGIRGVNRRVGKTTQFQKG